MFTYLRIQTSSVLFAPLENGDHPKVDDSKELDLDGIKKFQLLIGSLQWVIQIGCFNVATAVMTMSSFRANRRDILNVANVSTVTSTR
jgi:hypothetical protein